VLKDPWSTFGCSLGKQKQIPKPLNVVRYTGHYIDTYRYPTIVLVGNKECLFVAQARRSHFK